HGASRAPDTLGEFGVVGGNLRRPRAAQQLELGGGGRRCLQHLARVVVEAGRLAHFAGRVARVDAFETETTLLCLPTEKGLAGDECDRAAGPHYLGWAPARCRDELDARHEHAARVLLPKE